MKIIPNLKKNITFNDINPGMVVQRRDGCYCVMGVDKRKLFRKGNYLYTSEYNKETLKMPEKWDLFDIIKVFSTTQEFDLIQSEQRLELGTEINLELLHLIWERKMIL